MKVQNEMSTRISVDAVSAIGSMSAFRNAIKGTSDAWRAQEVALRNSGNYAEAAKQRLSGLNQVIDLQKAKIEELRQRQDGLDTSNKKQANQFLKLEKQIQQANRQLASYESQAERARNAARYQVSGLAALQQAYRQSQSASLAYVNRLNAEGKTASATVEKYRQLRSSLTNLEAQYRKQEFLLRQVANESGKDSESYIKQREQLDRTATAIAKTRTEMKRLAAENAKLQPTGLKRVDSAVLKIHDHTARMRSRMVVAFDSMKAHAVGFATTLGAVGAGMVSSAQKAASLQDTYTKTQNLLVTGGEKVAEVTKNVNKMQSEAQKESVQYGVSQQKIADAYQELTKRGYSSSQSLGAMKTMLQASVASGDDLNDVVTSSTAAMEAFGLRADGTAKMLKNTKMAVNEMAYAADMTATDFKSMSVAMEYAGPQAKTLGYTVGETASAIGILSNNGLEADKAGTGLRQVMNSLIKPTQGANEALKKIGLSTKDFTDKSGKMKSIDDIFKELNDHTANLSKQEKGAIFKALFGSTGESAGIILANNSKELGKLNKKVEESYKGQGYVQQLANKNMGSAKMSMNQFKEAADAVQVTIGRALLPSLRDASVEMAKAFNSKDGQRDLKILANGIGTVADATVSFMKLLSKHTTTVKVFGGALLAAFGAAKLLDAIGKTRRRINDFRAVIDKIPRKKKTTITADTSSANRNIKNIKQNIERVPKSKNTKINAETKQAQRNITNVNREMARVPKSKQSTVTVNSRSAVNNIKAVGTASKTSATVSKISFASIGTAAKSAGTTISMAFRANPLGMLITGIQIAISAFKLLYAHSKTFRKFVNGLTSSAKSAGKKIGNWFSSTFKKVVSDQQKANKSQQKANQQNQRAWNNYLKQHRKAAQQHQKEEERQARASQQRRARAVANFNKDVTRKSNNMWKQLQKDSNNGRRNAEQTWNKMSRTIGNTASSLWKSMSKGASDGWHDVEHAAQDGSSKVSHWYDDMSKNTGRIVQNIRQQHPKLFNDMYKGIEDSSQTWRDLVTGHWSRLGSDTQNLTKDMHNVQHDLFSTMYDKLNNLTHGGLDTMKKSWDNHLNAIHDATVNIGGHIHQAFDNLMNGLIDVFGHLVNGIVDGINWILKHVGGDGNLQHVNLKHFANGSNGPIDRHQVAVLNDAPNEDYREMVHKHKTGETFLLPAKRNIMMPLEPGDEVLDGKRAAQMMKLMGTPIHHADGAIGDFFSGIFDKSKDALEDVTDWVEKALKNVVGFGKSLFNHFIKSVTPKSTDSLNGGLKISLPGFFATRLKDWLKKQLDKLNTDNPAGTGVERWRPVILRAFDALHVAPAEWKVNKLLKQIQTESGGDPHAFQHGYVDANTGGNEARGLLQFAGSTWAADALPGHTDWRNGYNQILAAINVLEHGGEGGWGNVGMGHGWAYGGMVTQHGLYEVAENNDPEMIVPLDPNKRGRAYQLLTQVLARFKGEEGIAEASDVKSNQYVQSLERKFDSLLAQNQQMINLIDKLIGVTDAANNPTARYRRTQHDINMARAQSLTN